MDNHFKSFFNHLIQIGFVSSSTRNILIDIYNQSKAAVSPQKSSVEQGLTELSVKERITNALLSYLDLLNNNQKKDLMSNIYTQYIKTIQKGKSNSFRRLIVIYEQFKQRKLMSNKIKTFRYWKKLLNGLSYSAFLNLSYQSDKSHRFNRNGSPLETSRILKEKEELSHCTFYPSLDLTRYYKGKTQCNNKENLSLSVHNRLYTDYKKRCAKREMLRLESDNRMAKDAPFQPRFVSISPNEKNDNFKNRMNSFEMRKMENKKRLIEAIEHNYSSVCSFSPNIEESQKAIPLARSPSCMLVPAYKRLYMQRDMKKSNEKEETHKKKELKSSASVSNGCAREGPVDYKKIEELYNDYKRLNEKTEFRKSELDKERGLTFAPRISLNERYTKKLNDNFHEREKKFLEEKKKFVDIFNEMLDEHARGQRWGYAKYTAKEKEEIAKGVVDRLYSKGKRYNIAQVKRRESGNEAKEQRDYHNEFEEDLINERSSISD